VDESEQAALIAAVDAATSDLMRRILQDKQFKSLEASWRGLYLLVRRAETGPELKLYIVDLAKDELADDLRSASDLRDTRLFEIAVTEAIDTPGEDPWALMVGDFSFSPVKDDVAALMRIAKIAAASGAPFISHIRPDILGVHSLENQGDSSGWRLDGGDEASKLWTVLRNIPEAEYLGMTIPRFLCRLPYGRESEPLERVNFEEFDNTPHHDEYVWSNSCFVAATLLAQSFSAYGWEMDRRFIQDIEQLPMHMYKEDGETVYQPCAEVLLTQSACERMMEHGLMPLVSYKNTDHVKLARFQSIADPVTGLAGRWAR
jgi:type VI secretion system protein ImpC